MFSVLMRFVLIGVGGLVVDECLFGVLFVGVVFIGLVSDCICLIRLGLLVSNVCIWLK